MHYINHHVCNLIWFHLGSELEKLSKDQQEELNRRAIESQDAVPALVEAVQGQSRQPVHNGELNRIEAPVEAVQG